MNRDIFAPLLSESEISQINADREERTQASIAYRTPATVVHLLRHRDGSERLITGGLPEELELAPLDSRYDFGGSRGWIESAPKRITPKRWIDSATFASLFAIALGLVGAVVMVVAFTGVAP